MEKIPMTRAGHAQLDEELRELKAVERPAVIRAIAEAREHGDLSENAEYHAAREKQSFIEGRIAELESVVPSSEVIDVSKMTGDQVRFGAYVTIVDEESEDEKTYRIVGQYEADMKKGSISISSPLARALLGKSVGDSVEVPAPGGARSVEAALGQDLRPGIDHVGRRVRHRVGEDLERNARLFQQIGQFRYRTAVAHIRIRHDQRPLDPQCRELLRQQAYGALRKLDLRQVIDQGHPVSSLGWLIGFCAAASKIRQLPEKRPLFGKPLGTSRPACARSPRHSSSSASPRTKRRPPPSVHVSPSAIRNTFASARPPSL